MHLGKDIQQAAKDRGIDPYNTPFRPKDLGLACRINGNLYHDFSSWCRPDETKCSNLNHSICLRVAARSSTGRPYKFLLLPEDEWYIKE